MDDFTSTARYGAPGLQASKGDKVYSTLENLWAKIMQLEQKKQIENNGSQATTGASVNESDETLGEVQSKLLSLQLKYIRKLLKERNQMQSSKDGGGSTNGVSSSSTSSSQTKTSENDGDDHLDMIPVKLEKERAATTDDFLGRVFNGRVNGRILSEQTSSSIETSMNTPVRAKEPSKSVQPERDYQAPLGCKKDHQYSVTATKTIPPGRLKTCANSHYHVKLPDVPFIVGQSSGVSHSVIANVQSIIGMMKMHNPALCKAAVTSTEKKRLCCSTANSKETGTGLHQLKKEVKKMARELSDLTVKQEMLKQKLAEAEHIQDKNQTYQQEYNNISKLMESKAREIVEFHKKIKQESRDPSPSHIPTRESKSQFQPESSRKIRREPKGKTVEVGKVTRLGTRPKIEFHDELQVEDIQWTR